MENKLNEKKRNPDSSYFAKSIEELRAEIGNTLYLQHWTLAENVPAISKQGFVANGSVTALQSHVSPFGSEGVYFYRCYPGEEDWVDLNYNGNGVFSIIYGSLPFDENTILIPDEEAFPGGDEAIRDLSDEKRLQAGLYCYLNNLPFVVLGNKLKVDIRLVVLPDNNFGKLVASNISDTVKYYEVIDYDESEYLDLEEYENEFKSVNQVSEESNNNKEDNMNSIRNKVIDHLMSKPNLTHETRTYKDAFVLNNFKGDASIDVSENDVTFYWNLGEKVPLDFYMLNSKIISTNGNNYLKSNLSIHLIEGAEEAIEEVDKLYNEVMRIASGLNLISTAPVVEEVDDEDLELDPYFMDALHDFFSDYGFNLATDTEKQISAGTLDTYGEEEFEITIEAEYPKIVVSIDNTSRDKFHPEVAKALKTLGFKAVRNYLVFDKLDVHEDSVDILRKLIDNVQAMIQNNVEEQSVSTILSNELTPKIIDTAKTLGSNLGFELSKEGKNYLSFQRSVEPGYKFDVFIDNTSATVELTKRGLSNETIANDAKLRGYTVATDMIKKEFTKSEGDTTRYLHDTFSAYHELLRLIELSANLTNNDDDFEDDVVDEVIDPDVIDIMTNFIANKQLEVDMISDDYISATDIIDTPDRVFEFGVGANGNQITIYVEDSKKDFPTELAELLYPLGFTPYLDYRVIIQKPTQIDVADELSDIYDKVVETITEYANKGKYPIHKKVADENGKEVYKVVGMATEMTDDDKKFVRKLARQYKFRLKNMPSKDGSPGKFVCTRELADGMNIEIIIAQSNTYASLDITSKYGISDFFAGRAESIGCTYDKFRGIISCMIDGDEPNFVVKIFEKADELAKLYNFDPNEFIEEFEKVSKILGYTRTKVRFSDDPAYKKRLSNGEIVVSYTKPPFSSLDFEYIPDNKDIFDDIVFPNGFTERYGKLNYHPTVAYWYEMKDKFEVFEKELSNILGTVLESEDIIEEDDLSFESYLSKAMDIEELIVVDTDENDKQIILESEYNTSDSKLNIRLDLMDRLIVITLFTDYKKSLVDKVFGSIFNKLKESKYLFSSELFSEIEAQKSMTKINKLFKELVSINTKDNPEEVDDSISYLIKRGFLEDQEGTYTLNYKNLYDIKIQINKNLAICSIYGEDILDSAELAVDYYKYRITGNLLKKSLKLSSNQLAIIKELYSEAIEICKLAIEIKNADDNARSESDLRKIDMRVHTVYDSNEKSQLDRIVKVVKQFKKEIEADNLFNAFFLEEPKERKKYRLPTVGLALCCYDKDIKSWGEVSKSPLVVKMSKSKKIVRFRNWFRTIDPDGVKCWMHIWVDAEYAKATGNDWLYESKVVRLGEDIYLVESVDDDSITLVNENKILYIPLGEIYNLM